MYPTKAYDPCIMKNIDFPYFAFLRYSLNVGTPLPESARHIDWMQMLEWAEQQAIVGIIYGGITDVRSQREDGRGSALQIPFDALMEWVGMRSR